MVVKLQELRSGSDERTLECSADGSQSSGVGRRVLIEGQSAKAVATAVGVDGRTAGKWVKRFETEGLAGLVERTSRPHRLYRPTPSETVDQVIALRRRRFCGRQIAGEAGVSPATVSRILRAAGISRAKDLDPPVPVVRYEREHPGDLSHLDIKKLGRTLSVGPY